MAFKWKCSECLKEIIVPYKSPQTMNGMTTPLCPSCFNSFFEQKDNKEYKEDIYDVETEDENITCRCYSDPGIFIFECKPSICKDCKACANYLVSEVGCYGNEQPCEHLTL